MSVNGVVSNSSYHLRVILALVATFNFTLGAPIAQAAASNDSHTKTPIKHVIVIIGENRTFDHIFALPTNLSVATA